jgi:hypothetical protein
MKKLSIIVLLLLSLFILTSCDIVEGDVSDRITSPDNNIPPILGKWVIGEAIKSSYLNANTDYEAIVGRDALFHKDGVVIGDSYTTQPSYKIKYVNAADYLLYKYKSTPKLLGIEQENIEVVTILNDNTYFFEFIKISDDYMLININDTFYSMERVVEEVSLEEIQRYINVEKTMLRTFGVVEDENLQTGVLLGIKIPTYDEANQVPDWDYKTIWINSQNRKISGIYELDTLLLPRKNGFWVIDTQRKITEKYITDEITATPKFRIVKDEIIEDDLSFFMVQMEVETKLIEEKNSMPSILKNILFIGNDYISVENIDLDRNSRRTLQVYAIDNLQEKRPIKLSDLIGENGKNIYAEGARSVLSVDPTIIPNEENVGLTRRNGYWIFNGRINYKQNDEELFKDFNLRAIPPKEMVSYDELSIPWDAIRLVIPDVVDVFSSPNNEFMVVITSSHMVIYYMEDGDIINDPVAKIKLPYDSSVIMSEWALGRYAKLWENEVIENGGIQIDY